MTRETDNRMTRYDGKPYMADRGHEPEKGSVAGAPNNAANGAADVKPDLLLREMRMRKARNKIRRMYVLMILVSFVIAVILIFRYSLIIEISEQIKLEKESLVKIENENSQLRKQIDLETDLEKIRLLAESKLDMQKPDKDQIVYISVPKKDHALVMPPANQSGANAVNPFAYLYEQARLMQKRLFSDDPSR